MNIRKKHRICIAILALFLLLVREFGKRQRILPFSEEELDFAKNLSFIPAFHPFPADYFTAFQYNITTCTIRKSMSQMVFNTMCLLHDSEHFLRGNHTLSETWKHNRTCAYEDPDGFATFPENLQISSDFTRFVLIRDPFDRFLSLYLDKCVREHYCFDCVEDMRCVVKKIYETLKKHTSRNELLIADFMDLHSAPASWFCDFGKYLKSYRILLIGPEKESRKNPITKLSKIFRRKGVPDDIILKIVNESLDSETSHSTYTSTRRIQAAEQIKNDPIVREYLHKIYLNDYLIFPFDRSHLDPEYQLSYWDEKYKQDYADYIRIQESNAHLFN